MKINREIEKIKEYHRSRKFVLCFVILIFLNSVMTLNLRARQRKRNFDYIISEMHLKYNSRKEEMKTIINHVEDISKDEDTVILFSTNFIALIILIGFDRLGIFEKTGDTYKAKKEQIRSKVLGKER